MKITNWCRKLSTAILAAGIWVPSMAMAVEIPLGDPSFEEFAVPPAVGYAYADEFRPTSAWVDDLDSPTSYTQDDGDSNWLYNGAYAETGSGDRKRPAPRTGVQAMHGFFNYSAQETGAVFEAGKTYTFSAWAQGDDDATPSSSRLFLYLFDGSAPFSEGNSLAFQRYAPETGDFVNRALGATEADSQASWQQVSLSYSVLAGSTAIGNPVGVAFWAADDAALDDLSLVVSATIPEPATLILVGLAGVSLVACRPRR